ncbi:MAG: hypothetical protein ACRC51_00695 [Cetobacterium sp.]
MGRIERIKELKTEIEETKHQVSVAVKKNNFANARECITFLEEAVQELNCLYDFDEEAAQLVGGNF